MREQYHYFDLSKNEGPSGQYNRKMNCLHLKADFYLYVKHGTIHLARWQNFSEKLTFLTP